MAVTDSDVAMLRDWIDDLRWELAPVTAPGESGGYQSASGKRAPVTRCFRALAEAAFTIAVRRRLTSACTTGDVVRFVANARARHRGLADVLDPRVAESVTLRATGHQTSGDYERDRKLSAGLDLLRVLVYELELDSAGIDDLLADARRLADRWIANQERSRK